MPGCDGVASAHTLESSIDQVLTANSAELFSLRLSDAILATICSTYSTGNTGGATLGRADDGDASIRFELPPATEEAYDAIWQEEEIALNKRGNTFPLTGNSVHCRLLPQVM